MSATTTYDVVWAAILACPVVFGLARFLIRGEREQRERRRRADRVRAYRREQMRRVDW